MVNVYLNSLNLFHFLILVAGPLILLIDYMIFSVPIPGCYKDVYVSSVFPHTARLKNSLLAKCFPLIYDLKGFKSRVSRHLLFWSLSDPLSYILFIFFLFLVIPYLLVAVQPCMELNPIKKSRNNEIWNIAPNGTKNSTTLQEVTKKNQVMNFKNSV